MGHPEMETEESLARQWEARCEIAERGLKRWREAARVWLAAGKRALEERDQAHRHIDAAGDGMNLLALLDDYYVRMSEARRAAEAYRRAAIAARRRSPDAQAIQRQAAEIDSLRAGLRALTNIRDEGAAETHRWRERALAAEASIQRATDETYAEACERQGATEEAESLRERLKSMSERWGRTAADLELAVKFARRGWEEARALRGRAPEAEDGADEAQLRGLLTEARWERDEAVTERDKLKAEVAHLKAKRAADHAEAERVVVLLNQKRETLDTLVRHFDAVKARIKTLCRADLDRPASIESQASRSLAWSVLRELGVTVPDGEPETPAPAVSSPAAALVDPMRSIAQVKPTAPAIDPGEGWRLLREGEKIEEGDETQYHDGTWHLSADVGLVQDAVIVADDGDVVGDLPRRRRIAAPPPAEPVAYPPSSAPEAVEVAPPQPAPVVCSADVESSEPRAQHPEQHEEAPPVLPAPRPVLPRPMPPELRAAIIRAQMAGGGS